MNRGGFTTSGVGPCIAIISTAFTLVISCAPTDVVRPGGEGNGSGTVAWGVIVDGTGAPVAGVQTRLLPVDDNPW